MSIEALSADDIEARKASLVARANAVEVEQAAALTERASAYRYIHPFSETTDSLLEALQNSDGRFRLGLPEMDVLTRGFGPKELVLVVGFSHQGKTQLINTAIMNNAGKRILFFSLDDPAELILLKLVCMHEGIGAEELERRVRRGDQDAVLLLRQAASHKYGNLICIDESLSLDQMSLAVDEATSFWGALPDCVIIDYLGSVAGADNGDGDGGIKNKAAALKRWCKGNDFPTIVVHQNTRSRGAPGEPITILSGAFGGEQEATILIGVRRKRDDESLDPWERSHNENTVNLHVVKNKRPPARVTPPEGIAFHMDPTTGLIRSIRDSERNLAAAIERESRA